MRLKPSPFRLLPEKVDFPVFWGERAGAACREPPNVVPTFSWPASGVTGVFLASKAVIRVFREGKAQVAPVQEHHEPSVEGFFEKLGDPSGRSAKLPLDFPQGT